jgi:hypothetical protein
LERLTLGAIGISGELGRKHLCAVCVLIYCVCKRHTTGESVLREMCLVVILLEAVRCRATHTRVSGFFFTLAGLIVSFANGVLCAGVLFRSHLIWMVVAWRL